jgi:hypothetical protein
MGHHRTERTDERNLVLMLCYPRHQFKTLKYMPDFPDRFGSLEDARAFCDRFFMAYNHEHRHSGIGCTLPPRCTSAPPSRSEPNGKSRSTAPTPSTRNASHADPDRPNYPTALGSTNPSTSHNQPCKHNLSHLT